MSGQRGSGQRGSGQGGSGQGGGQGQEPADAAEQAAQWFATMRGPQAGARTPQFEAWLNQGAHNREAFARICKIFDDSLVLRSSAHYGPLRQRRSLRDMRQVLVSGAIAACLALAVFVGLVPASMLPWSSTPTGQTHMLLETAPRTMRTFALPGGGAVTLDRASKVIVGSRDGTSTIKLVMGRMQLNALDSAQTYTIAAGANTITARAALMDVTLAVHQAPRVRLYIGEAEVQPLLQNAAYRIQGQRLPVGRPLRLLHGRIGNAGPSFVTNEKDWPSGWGQYRAIAISRLVSIANSYAEKPIVIDDPAIGTMSVSGRFRFTDTSALAANLATVFGFQVTERPDGLHLRQN